MTKMEETSSHTDDVVFEMAEFTCLVAEKDPTWVPLFKHFTTTAQQLENPGFKKGAPVSQNMKILKMLKDGKTITRLTAMHYGIMNLTARISELRNFGYDIRCRMKKDAEGREYGEFYLQGTDYAT